METEIRQQLMQLAAAFLLGLALGAVYDAFRVWRRKSGKEALPDVLFSALLCLSLFCLGMSPGEGELGWAMAFFAIFGFGFYMLTLSSAILLFLTRLCDATANLIKKCLKPLKSGVNFIKTSAKNCFFKIRARCRIRKNTEGEEHEK